jgi:hypothetical protein
MEILLIGYATLRFGTDTLASSGISVKDNQKSHFYVASTHGRSRYIYSRIRSKDGVFSLHCPYGYSKRPKKSVIIIKQEFYEPLFGKTDSMR